MKTYVIDLDHTLCDTPKNESGNWDYTNAVPFIKRIEKVNKLKDEGNTIIIETARGSVSGRDWFSVTEKQLLKWGLKYDKLRVGTKFAGDYFIDDKGINSEDFFNGIY